MIKTLYKLCLKLTSDQWVFGSLTEGVFPVELQDNSYLRMGSATVPNTPIFATKSQNGDKKSYV